MLFRETRHKSLPSVRFAEREFRATLPSDLTLGLGLGPGLDSRYLEIDNAPGASRSRSVKRTREQSERSVTFLVVAAVASAVAVVLAAWVCLLSTSLVLRTGNRGVRRP